MIKKLAQDIRSVLYGDEVHDWVTKHGGELMSMTQPEFARFVLTESETAKRVIRAAIKSR